MSAQQTIEDAASNIAAAIGEPARTRMLFSLLDGRARTSTELALAADVSPSTASAHLARLRGARLVNVHVQGRHRYYRIEDRRVAAMLERLSVLAGADMHAAPFRASTPEYLVRARTCYDHIAGTLGVALHDALVSRGWVGRAGTAGVNYSLTDEGERHLAAVGVNVGAIRSGRRRVVFGCLDWSERRPHLGGALGAAICSMMVERKWVKDERESRALRITAIGRREMAMRLGIRLDG
jgi:DNA-binding transcriptional ArsR family regulator